MNKRKINRVLLAVVAIIALVCLGRGLFPPPKARAPRIQTVNNLASTFPQVIILTNVVMTNGASVPASGH